MEEVIALLEKEEHLLSVQSRIDALEKELASAKAEILDLQLRIKNVTLLLKKEMLASGILPKPPDGDVANYSR